MESADMIPWRTASSRAVIQTTIQILQEHAEVAEANHGSYFAEGLRRTSSTERTDGKKSEELRAKR
jgi:hypothetical protein